MEPVEYGLEQYLMHLRHLNVVKQVIVSDTQGNTIICALDDVGCDEKESTSYESNVVLSGARFFTILDHLSLGVPSYIHSQFHDAVVVQSLDRACLLTLIGSRAEGHCVGSLLSVMSQLKQSELWSSAVDDLSAVVQ